MIKFLILSFLMFTPSAYADVCSIYSLIRKDIDVITSKNLGYQTCEKLVKLECTRMATLLLDTSLQVKKRWSSKQADIAGALFMDLETASGAFDLDIKRHSERFSLEYETIFSAFNVDMGSFLDKEKIPSDIDLLYEEFRKIDEKLKEYQKKTLDILKLQDSYLGQLYQEAEVLEINISLAEKMKDYCADTALVGVYDRSKKLRREVADSSDLLRKKARAQLKYLELKIQQVKDLMWIFYAENLGERTSDVIESLLSTLNGLDLAGEVLSWWQSASFRGLSNRLETRFLLLTEAQRTLQIKLSEAKNWKQRVRSEMSDKVRFKAQLLEDIDGYIAKIEEKAQRVSSLTWQDIFDRQKSMNEYRRTRLEEYPDTCPLALENYDKIAEKVDDRASFYKAELAYKQTHLLCEEIAL